METCAVDDFVGNHPCRTLLSDFTASARTQNLIAVILLAAMMAHLLVMVLTDLIPRPDHFAQPPQPPQENRRPTRAAGEAGTDDADQGPLDATADETEANRPTDEDDGLDDDPCRLQ